MYMVTTIAKYYVDGYNYRPRNRRFKVLQTLSTAKLTFSNDIIMGCNKDGLPCTPMLFFLFDGGDEAAFKKKCNSGGSASNCTSSAAAQHSGCYPP